MKNKFKLGLFVVIMFIVFSFVGFVNAADLNWSVNQTIDLTSPDIDLTVLSGSKATSLVVNAGSIDVVIPDPDTFTITSANSALLVTGNTTAIVSNTCSSGVATLSIIGNFGGETITITPTGVACTKSSNGSSSGSSSKPKTVTPAVVTPPVADGGPICSYNLGMATLKNGSRGAEVMELQRFLNATMNLGLVVDGALGPKTIAVMMKWQTANGLLSDGLIGPMTKAKINGIAGARCGNSATPATPGETPATPNAQGYAFGTLTVKEGTKGEACKAWQNFLNDKTNAGLVADGDCGPKTIQAVKAWQASVGLTADGFLGAMSRAKALAQ